MYAVCAHVSDYLVLSRGNADLAASVQTLDLAGNKFEEHGSLRQSGEGGKLGMSFLHMLLHRECALTELQLRGCELGNGPTKALAMALGESHASLRTLGLADNRLGDAAAGATPPITTT